MFGFPLDIYVGTSNSFRQFSITLYVLTLKIRIGAKFTAGIYRKNIQR